MEIFLGILIPFIGTTLGAACVLFMKKTLRKQVQRALAGFAAGVMVAASIWSLIIFPGSSRFLDWRVVFAYAGSFDSTPSCWK